MYWPAFALPYLQHWSREYLPAGPAHGGYIPAHLSVRDGVSGQGRADLSPPKSGQQANHRQSAAALLLY